MPAHVTKNTANLVCDATEQLSRIVSRRGESRRRQHGFFPKGSQEAIEIDNLPARRHGGKEPGTVSEVHFQCERNVTDGSMSALARLLNENQAPL